MLFDDGTREIRIDARTSDAIAIALRTWSDIYVMQNIIDEAGFVYEENEGKEVVETEELPEEKSLSNCSRKELKERLEEYGKCKNSTDSHEFSPIFYLGIVALYIGIIYDDTR